MAGEDFPPGFFLYKLLHKSHLNGSHSVGLKQVKTADGEQQRLKRQTAE